MPVDISGEDAWFEDMLEREQLHSAAQDGDEEKVSLLISQQFPLEIFDSISLTPLHHAARNGHTQIMRLLLDAGVDVNAYDEQRIGNTVLREVAGHCSLEVAKILVEAGANPTITGWMNITALDESAKRTDGDGIRVHALLQQSAKNRTDRK
jgi:ankyrin repeat protein